MRTRSTSGVAWRVVGFSARLLLFTLGGFLAVIGAYLFLSGLIIVADQKILPGLLDVLIGFVFINTGWRIISSRILRHVF